MRAATAGESTELARADDAYSEIDIARSLPTYGPAATAGYSVLTFGMLAFALSAGGYLFMELFSTSAPMKVRRLLPRIFHLSFCRL